MLRLEIIANNSVEENILDAFKAQGVGKYYTKYPGIRGVGNSGPRMGDPIWPEENFALVIFCEVEEALGIERAVAAVKKRFPNEGIKLFGINRKPAVRPAPAAPINAPAARPAAPINASPTARPAPAAPINAPAARPATAKPEAAAKAKTSTIPNARAKE